MLSCFSEYTALRKALCFARKTFRSVQRHGKRLFLELEEDLWLTLHLGMTGWLIYQDMGEVEPAHTRMLIRFQNGRRLAFDDLRIFGEVGLTESPSIFLTEGKIGADALLIDRDDFLKIMRSRRGTMRCSYLISFQLSKRF